MVYMVDRHRPFQSVYVGHRHFIKCRWPPLVTGLDIGQFLKRTLWDGHWTIKNILKYLIIFILHFKDFQLILQTLTDFLPEYIRVDFSGTHLCISMGETHTQQ